MKIEKKKFIKDILEIFEKKKDFKDFDEYIEIDSITILTLSAYFEDKFEMTLNKEDIESFKTLNDLIKKAKFK